MRPFNLGNFLSIYFGNKTLPKHLKVAVNIQYEMLKNSKLCWLSKIQKVYNNAGLSCKFFSAVTESTKQHINEVMTCLSDQFMQDCFAWINLKGRKGVINLEHTNCSRRMFNLSII